MKREPIPLASWEAVVPGVVFPLLGVWLGGTGWAPRGMAAAANLAPLLVLGVLARFGGRWVAAVQGAASVAYTLLALAWIGSVTDFAPLAWLGERVGMVAPLLAAGVAAVLYPLIRMATPRTATGDPAPAGGPDAHPGQPEGPS